MTPETIATPTCIHAFGDRFLLYGSVWALLVCLTLMVSVFYLVDRSELTTRLETLETLLRTRHEVTQAYRAQHEKSYPDLDKH